MICRKKYITFISSKRKIVLNIGTILYASMEGNKAVINNAEIYAKTKTANY